jgi:hypothetical protein
MKKDQNLKTSKPQNLKTSKPLNTETQRHGEKQKAVVLSLFVFPLSLFRKAVLYLCVERFVFFVMLAFIFVNIQSEHSHFFSGN